MPMRVSGSRHLFANRRYLLLVLVLVVALYVLLPQFGDFRASWHLLRHPVAHWTAAAIGFTTLTYLAAALTYCWLAFKPLGYGQTVVVQLAAMFVNRLLPAGLGALGTNYAYLRRKAHTTAQAATVVAINNLLGLTGHLLVVSVALAVTPPAVHVLPSQSGRLSGHTLDALVIAVMLVTVLAIFGRQRVRRVVADLAAQVLSYRSRLGRLAGALLSSMALTLCNVLCLGCCALALGVHLPFVVILLIFSFGLGAGTATPTPGGLGGFEAGLTAGFIAYHVASPTALATALLYRLVSYWLPLLAGAPSLFVAQKQRLFKA